MHFCIQGVFRLNTAILNCKGPSFPSLLSTNEALRAHYRGVAAIVLHSVTISGEMQTLANKCKEKVVLANAQLFFVKLSDSVSFTSQLWTAAPQPGPGNARA